jgi:hypothetical protein
MKDTCVRQEVAKDQGVQFGKRRGFGDKIIAGMEVELTRIIEETMRLRIGGGQDPRAFIDKVWLEEILVGPVGRSKVDKNNGQN